MATPTPPMRLKIETEQQAFPSNPVFADGHTGYEYGMSLRDWYAGLAMEGLLHGVDEPQCRFIAVQAFAMADAMMKRREE